jgi:hypothetical protein
MMITQNCFYTPRCSIPKYEGAPYKKKKNSESGKKNKQWWKKDRFSNVSVDGWDFRKTDEERELEILAATIEPPATQKEINAVAASRAKRKARAPATKKKAPSRRNRIAVLVKPSNKNSSRFQFTTNTDPSQYGGDEMLCQKTHY